jgi:hypothetical protein
VTTMIGSARILGETLSSLEISSHNVLVRLHAPTSIDALTGCLPADLCRPAGANVDTLLSLVLDRFEGRVGTAPNKHGAAFPRQNKTERFHPENTGWELNPGIWRMTRSPGTDADFWQRERLQHREVALQPLDPPMVSRSKTRMDESTISNEDLAKTMRFTSVNAGALRDVLEKHRTPGFERESSQSADFAARKSKPEPSSMNTLSESMTLSDNLGLFDKGHPIYSDRESTGDNYFVSGLTAYARYGAGVPVSVNGEVNSRQLLRWSFPIDSQANAAPNGMDNSVRELSGEALDNRTTTRASSLQNHHAESATAGNSEQRFDSQLHPAVVHSSNTGKTSALAELLTKWDNEKHALDEKVADCDRNAQTSLASPDSSSRMALNRPDNGALRGDDFARQLEQVLLREARRHGIAIEDQ